MIITTIASLSALACATAALAQPLTTSFTYQGSLSDAGVPANGTFDLRFRLYDQAASPGGVQIGPTLCVDDITIVDGRFSTQLDFGTVFAGQRRFLEVSVRPGSAGTCGFILGYTPLLPRQELTAAPNAAFSLVAGSATNATSLNGQPATFYTNASNLTAGTISDSRLSGNVTTNSLNQTFTGIKTFASPPNFSGGSSPFTVSGNGLVTNLNADLLDGLNSTAFAPTVHSHDASAIVSGTLTDARLSTNIPRLASVNAFSAVNSFSGFVGLGTTTPTSRLNIRDPLGLPLILTEASVGPFKISDGFSALLMDSNQIESVGGTLFLNLRGSTAANPVSIGAGGGNVGIGTAAPNARLEVVVAPTQSFQFRQDGFVPGINVVSEGGNAGIMRLRNAMEVWPSDDGTRAGKIDVRNTSGDATITLNGATGVVSSANFPASKAVQTFRDPRGTSPVIVNPGAFRVFETISVTPPGPGNLILTATANVVLPDYTDGSNSRAWLKIEETTGGPVVMLTEAVLVTSTISNLSGIVSGGVITIVWTVPNSGTTTRTFRTTVTCGADGGNPGEASVFTTTLTVQYMPAGL